MKQKLVIIGLMVALLATAFSLACAKKVATGPITLNLVASFAKDAVSMRAPSYFVDEVNKRAQGELTINWKGGPEIIPTFDQPDAVIKGTFDLNGAVTNYYAGVLPASYVLALSRLKPDEQGPGTKVHDFLVKMFAAKGIRYVGEYGAESPSAGFYIYLNKEIRKPEELAGMKIRVSPLTRQFAEALGTAPITMPAGDIYLAMERKTVDGFIWPLYDTFNEMGWPEVTKYAIDYPLYQGIAGIFANLNVWNKLSGSQQKLITDAHIAAANWNVEFFKQQHASQRERAIKAGMKFIKFSEADGARYVKTAEDALWPYFQKNLSAEDYQTIRKLLKYE